MHWEHDWEVQPRLPIKYEQDKFDEVFQETDIAVLQFAKGEELKKFQDEAVDRATRLPKITIHNETEVIESETTTAELGEVTHPWTTVALDCARMQAYLPKGESMPGTAFIEQYFPQTQVAMNKARKVRVAHGVLICQHVAASAQQLHWDFKPRGSCDTKELLGSVLVAL